MATGELTRTDRFVNSALFVLLLVLGVSGVIMLYGVWQPWLFDLHRIAGFALVALLPWKGLTIYRSLRRGMEKTLDRTVVLVLSIVFAHFIALILVLAIMWTLRLGPYSSLTQTLIAWHWILGLAIFPILAIHVWRRWPSPRKEDVASRRAFLKMGAVAAAGLAGGALANFVGRQQATDDRPRRFTGSRGFGEFTGNDFPVTGERPVRLDADEWALVVRGAVDAPLTLTYDDVLGREAQTVTATIDCTNGWYSVQEWQGVPLMEVLREAGMADKATGVRLTSVTGYNHTYPLAEAGKILLATHVSGEVLAPRHGFPVRAVVPDRRGWFWVKWLREVRVLDRYRDLVTGIAGSPFQVLRQF
ncbi:MAG: molybdopterin-dependent oxidoreductase [Candidatus Promineifilaceae bacterium]|nr:molybdopterin-dependent oxidoreductase [Candidatus Promineifilaceae bacterium]